MSVPPIAKATLQAAVINAGSNIVAQGVALARMPPEHAGGNPSSSLTPLSFLWLEGLESSFPGTSEVPAPAPKSKGKGKGRGRPPKDKGKAKLNVRNTFAKVVIDQTIGGTWVTVLFIATMGMLKGMDNDAIVAQVRNDFWPIMTAGLKLWPFVSILNFTVVPADKRLLVGSLFGFLWAIYLSLMSG